MNIYKGMHFLTALLHLFNITPNKGVIKQLGTFYMDLNCLKYEYCQLYMVKKFDPSTYRGVIPLNDRNPQIFVGLHKFWDEIPPFWKKSRTRYRAHEIN